MVKKIVLSLNKILNHNKMFQSSKGVKNLFYTNVGIYLLTIILSIIAPSFVLNYLAVWNFENPHFEVWQLLTAQFIHGGIFHILGNMLALLSLGPLVEDSIGTNKFIWYYLLCGIVGNILQSFFSTGPAVGASGAVWGVVMMFSLISPNSKLSLFLLPIGIKSKYLIGVLFAIELFCCIFGSSDGIGHFAHIGGALAGILFYMSEKINRNPNV